MKLKHKFTVFGILLLVLAAVFCGCGAEQSPYEKNDAQGYTLSVRYDANGGFFTTNTSVITDSYDPAALPEQNGKLSLALLAPDDAARGNDAFAPVKNGYFLAGWYAQRTESTDADGNVTYTYGEKWDFVTSRLEVQKDEMHTSAEPVLTLYAAWVPLFKVEFLDKATGASLGDYSFDPTAGTELQLPAWNSETGAMELGKFPQKQGYTYENAYFEDESTPITDKTVTHPGKVDEVTGTASNTTLTLYVDYREGEWYRIFTAEQFIANASVTGSYEICADLDFTDKIWPTALMYGNYSGTIQGNGHTISNIAVAQTNNSKTNAGLFGMLTDTARIEDLALENVTFTIQTGTRAAGTSYGLLAGTVSTGVQLQGVTIANGCLQVDSGCYFGTDEYVIGLICGTGTTDIDPTGITTKAVGDAPETVTITVEGQSVSVEIAWE